MSASVARDVAASAKRVALSTTTTTMSSLAPTASATKEKVFKTEGFVFNGPRGSFAQPNADAMQEPTIGDSREITDVGFGRRDRPDGDVGDK